MATTRVQRLLSTYSRSRGILAPASSFVATSRLISQKQCQRFISDGPPRKASISDIPPPLQAHHQPDILATRGLSRTISVRPSGWESSSETERYPMTLLGHVMPHIYGKVIEIFKLPEAITAEQQEAIVESVRVGLEKTLEQYPILSGELEFDKENGEIGVRRNRESSAVFEVRYLNGSDSEFPSFKALEKRHFHAGMIEDSKVFPKYTAGLVECEGIPAAAFQLTFIPGGCIIGYAVHHGLSDGASCEQFWTMWSRNSHAASQGTLFPSTQKPSDLLGPLLEGEQLSPERFDETITLWADNRRGQAGQFTPIKKPFELQGSRLEATKPAPEELEKIKNTLPHVSNDQPEPFPEGFILPKVETTMWHFPQKQVERLKAEAMVQLGDGKWISTHDAIMALMWQSVTRARLEMLNPDMDATSVLGHVVDVHKKLGVDAPFMGVTSMIPQCGPVTIKELVSPAAHPKVALVIRDSINSLTPEYLHNYNQLAAATADKRNLRFNSQWFFGRDLGATSWMGMHAYKTHNFGFGLPRAARWPGPQVEWVYLFPTRRGMEGAEEDEGIEVCVALEAGCSRRMLEDPMLRWYAKPRGNEDDIQEIVREQKREEDAWVENLYI